MATTNAFAALQTAKKVKRKVAKRKVEAPPEPQLSSAGSSLLTKMNWADVTEDDDDALFYDFDQKQGPRGGNAALAEDSDSEEPSDSDEGEEEEDEEVDDDEEHSPPLQTEVVAASARKEVKSVSKKELIQKEIDDMSAALSELGISVDEVKQPTPGTSPRQQKKKRHKKEKPEGDIRPAAGGAADDEEKETPPPFSPLLKVPSTAIASVNTEPASAVDREEALKQLRSAKSKAKKLVSSNVSQLPSVRAEAKKKAECKKAKAKKNDKLPPYPK